jgi:hypothetical protein
LRASAVAGGFVFLFAVALVVKPGGEHGTRVIDDLGTLAAALTATAGAGHQSARAARLRASTIADEMACSRSGNDTSIGWALMKWISVRPQKPKIVRR